MDDLIRHPLPLPAGQAVDRLARPVTGPTADPGLNPRAAFAPVGAQNASGELCASTQERHGFAPPTRRLEPRRPASKPHHSPRDPQNSPDQSPAAPSRSETLTPYHSSLKPYAAPQPPRPNPRNRLFSRPQVPIIERFTADSPPRTSAPRKCLSKTRHSPLPIPHLY